MKYIYKKGDLNWVDLHQPTRKEVIEVMSEYTINPVVADDLLSPTPKNTTMALPHELYVVLHFPAFRQSHGQDSHDQEIDIVIKENTIITIHYEGIDSLNSYKKKVERILASSEKSELLNIGYLFFMLLHELYSASYSELEAIDAEIKVGEEKVFAGEEKDMVKKLSEISRKIINFKGLILPHREVLESIVSELPIYIEIDKVSINNMMSEYFRVKNTLSGLSDTLSELRHTNDSLLSTKQNETIKILTILAFVTFPLTLIAGIFGMNTQETPLIGRSHDFFIILAIMITLTLVMFSVFKYKKWL